MYQNGSIELQNTYTPKKYQFVLTLFQAAILSCYNEGSDEITVADLKRMTEMPAENFKASMMKLCNP